MVAIILAEFLVRKIKPQLTFSGSVGYSLDCYAKDDRVAFKLARNHRCRMVNINGEYNTFATLNSRGYRNKEFSIRKGRDTRRILILGDSMTFGWGVPDENTYPAVLENILNSEKGKRWEVINAGYLGGLSLDGYYIYLKEEGLSLSPDIIIAGFTVFNDISDLAGNIWEKVDKDGLPQKVVSCCHKVDGRILRNKIISFKYSIPMLRESHLFLLLTDFLQKNFNWPVEKRQLSTPGEEKLGCELTSDCIHLREPQEKKARDLLRALDSLAKKKGARFIVALLPVDLQLYPNSHEKYKRFANMQFPKKGEEDFINKRMGEFLKNEGIEYLDLYNGFAAKADLGYPFFPLDAHFNTVGTQVVAEELAKYLSP